MLTLGIFIVGYLGPVLLVIAGLDRLKRLDLLAGTTAAAALLAAARGGDGDGGVGTGGQPVRWSKTRHGETQMKRRVAPAVEAQAE